MAFEDPDDMGHLVKLDDSTFVERDVLSVVEKIYEYDPNLKVQYLNKAAALGDAPYRIIERCNDGEYRTIFYAWQLDDRVLDRLRAADCRVSDVWGNIDKNNKSLRQKEGRRFKENIEEAGDIVAHVLKSSKGRYTVNLDDAQGKRKLTIDDDPKPSWKVDREE